ncbi:MAG: hypothetical protein K0S41_4376 [Anaerocolumna sp.]|jgi:hypothetical protein|nr:hypothetical protein [Anaerocolumna sp.]
MKAVWVKADDWQGMFIDGNLAYEGHEISFREFKEICKRNKLNGSDVEEKWVTDDYYDRYLSRYGSFPNDLSEVELQEN